MSDSKVSTDGGAYIKHDVNTGGGDFNNGDHNYFSIESKTSIRPKLKAVLYKHLNFLDAISNSEDIEVLQEKARKLVLFARTCERGDFYADEILKLLPPESAIVSIRRGGSIPRSHIDNKNRERLEYIKKLRQSRPSIYELIEEMLEFN